MRRLGWTFLAMFAGMILLAGLALQLAMPAQTQASAQVAGGPFQPPPTAVAKIEYSALAKKDVGRIDPRISALIAASPWDLKISVLMSGHSLCVRGSDPCRYSNHVFGRAVDIYEVQGQPVDAQNQAARSMVNWLMTQWAPPPSEVGSPRYQDIVPARGVRWITDSDHRDHIHIGYGR